MRPTSSTTGRIAAVSTTLVLALALVAGACSGDQTASAELVSDPRPGTEDDHGDRTPDAADQQYCELAESAVDDASSDPDAALDALDTMAEAAPPDLSGDFEVLRDAIERLAALDPTDPAAIEEIMGIAVDPEVTDASAAISEHTSEVCGFDLDDGPLDDGFDDDLVPTDPLDPSDPGSSTTAPSSSTDIELEDVDAVKEAAQGQSWPDKLSGTMIAMGVDVQLSAAADTPLTPEEALIACTAMWTTLSQKNPAVTVQILNDSTVAAATTPEGPCHIA